MAVRIKDGMIPYTGGDGIEITNNHVINVKLREENNLTHINDDRELYTDLQLDNGIAPSDDFPVGANTGMINTEDGWDKNGQILDWRTISGDYSRLLVSKSGDHKVYIDTGDGIWREIGVEGSDPDINTKTFFLPADRTDLTEGQKAYDWYRDGKEPILVWNNETYMLAYTGEISSAVDPSLTFFSTNITNTFWQQQGVAQVGTDKLIFHIDPSDNTVITSIEYINRLTSGAATYKFLPTNAIAVTPFEPTDPGHPATKKYVDEQIATVQTPLEAGDYINIDANNRINNTRPFIPTNEGATGYLLSYTTNGQYQWIDASVIPTPGGDSNVQYFNLPDTTSASYSIAQDAYNRAMGGNAPILGLNGVNYFFRGFSGNDMIFSAGSVNATQGNSTTTISNDSIIVTMSNGDVIGITLSNTPIASIIDPTATYTTPYTPTQPGNPVTKNYVDTQIINISADVNTKTFFLPNDLSSQSAIDVMQSAYDWVMDGNYALLYYDNSVYASGYWGSSEIWRYDTKVRNSGLYIYQLLIHSNVTDGNITGITKRTIQESSIANVLTTNNVIPYTPTNNYHPATKRYVDKEVSDCLTESKNYTDTKVISGASFGGHVKAAKANGTRHEITKSVYRRWSSQSTTFTDTYTMQGLGWFRFGTYATQGAIAYVKLNGEILEEKQSSSSSSADSMSNSGILSVSTGDIIEVSVSGYDSESTATIVDYY